MTALKIALFIVGMAFLLFGYFIFFKKKYFLINDFEDDLKSGRKDEDYAKRVGLTEFVIGIVMLIAGIVLIVFA